MGLTFKSAIEQDNKEVFLNALEFADSHTINGKQMPAIVDDNELLERDKAHLDRKSTRLNSSHNNQSRMPSSA